MLSNIVPADGLAPQGARTSFGQESPLNTLRPRRNEQQLADDIFRCIFFNENAWIPIKISLKFVLKGPINNIPALVRIMAWRRPGDKPLSEPMMVRLPTHICVTRPQWIKGLGPSVTATDAAYVTECRHIHLHRQSHPLPSPQESTATNCISVIKADLSQIIVWLYADYRPFWWLVMARCALGKPRAFPWKIVPRRIVSQRPPPQGL